MSDYARDVASSRFTLLRALLQRDPEVADDRKAGVVVKYATADDAKVRIPPRVRQLRRIA